MAAWQDDKAWADGWLPVLTVILKQVAMDVLSITVASEDHDRHFATDYVVHVPQGDIACRLRRLGTCPGVPDFTLRYSRPSGVLTEYAKIRAGHAAWYLYGWIEPCTPHVSDYHDWINGVDQLRRWMFVDLTRCRSQRVFDRPWPQYRNYDGTTFVAIPLAELESLGALTYMSLPLQHLRPVWLGVRCRHQRRART